MTTENLSKEVEIRVKDFLTDVKDPKDLAKAIRKVNYVLSLVVSENAKQFNLK